MTDSVIQQLYLHADGSYDINMLKNTIKRAEIYAEGSGEIQLNIEEFLEASLHDTVEVHYKGHPKIKKSINDVAELSHM